MLKHEMLWYEKSISRHLAVLDISCLWWSGDPKCWRPMFTAQWSFCTALDMQIVKFMTHCMILSTDLS